MQVSTRGSPAARSILPASTTPTAMTTLLLRPSPRSMRRLLREASTTWRRTSAEPLCNDFFSELQGHRRRRHLRLVRTLREQTCTAPTRATCPTELSAPGRVPRCDLSTALRPTATPSTRRTSRPTFLHRLGVGHAAALPRHLPVVPRLITIVDDDDAPSLQVADASAHEGDEMTFEVTLNAPSSQDGHLRIPHRGQNRQRCRHRRHRLHGVGLCG